MDHHYAKVDSRTYYNKIRSVLEAIVRVHIFGSNLFSSYLLLRDKKQI
jgi:hypothetical protein